MRITNDCLPEEMLAEVLRLKGAAKDDTAGFNAPDWSNHEFVCEQLSLRVSAILRSYARLRNEVNVTQSMRDNGVDIILSFESDDQSSRRIGIQVKSNREAVAATRKDRSTESMEALIKRQAFESTRWSLNEWWVVLCFDVTRKEHDALVKRISAELLQARQPAEIRIYEPTEMWNFFSMGEEDVDALCVRRLCKNDEVLIAAQAEVSSLTCGAKAVVMATLFESLEDSANQSLSDLLQLTDEAGTRDIDQTAKVVDELEGSGYLKRFEGEDIWSTHASVYPGLCALYFEGRVRHGLSRSAAASFVRSLA